MTLTKQETEILRVAFTEQEEKQASPWLSKKVDQAVFEYKQSPSFGLLNNKINELVDNAPTSKNEVYQQLADSLHTHQIPNAAEVYEKITNLTWPF